MRCEKEGINVYIWLILVIVQQKLAQYCKAIILILKKVRSHLFIVAFVSFALGDRSPPHTHTQIAILYVKEFPVYVFFYEIYSVGE